MGQLDGAFVLTNPDARSLLDFVRAAHDDADAIKEFAKLAGVATGDINFDSATNPLWLAVLEAAGKQGKLRPLVTSIQAHPNSQNPQALALMAGLLAEPPEAPGIPAPLDDPGAPPPAVPPIPIPLGPGVYSEGLLWQDMPFIGREGLRNSLELMLPPGSRRSLLVIGDEGSGKTYTRQFLRYLKENGGGMQLRPIDMSMRAGEPIDERELAFLVADALLGTEPPTIDPTAQPETVVARVRTWLVGALEETTRPIWLVLDGFTPKTATAGAIQLVNELAQAAANGDLGPVHVVVLGYHGNPALTSTALCEALAAPTRDEIKTFFARAALALQGAQPEEAALDHLVDHFDATYGPLTTTPIGRLGPSAREQALALFRDAP